MRTTGLTARIHTHTQSIYGGPSEIQRLVISRDAFKDPSVVTP